MSEQDDNSAEQQSADSVDDILEEQGDDVESETVTAADSVKPAKMDELNANAAPATGAPDLDVIMDIPVKISMEVGNTEISIRNLLQLNQGSVIELDRLAGEPLDVLVNGTLIAHGEVVVVNDKFGIRMTDVISPSERIKKLK